MLPKADEEALDMLFLNHTHELCFASTQRKASPTCTHVVVAT